MTSSERNRARKGKNTRNRVANRKADSRASDLHRTLWDRLIAVLGAAPFLAGAIVWLASTLSLTFSPGVPAQRWIVGQEADRYVYSEVPFSFQDMGETQNRRRREAGKVPAVYRLEESSSAQALRLLDRLARRFASPPDVERQTDEKATGSQKDGMLTGLTDEQRQTLEYIVAQEKRFTVLQRAVGRAQSQGIAEPQALETLAQRADADGRIYVMDSLMRKVLRPVEDIRTPRQAATSLAQEHIRLFPDNAEKQTQALDTLLVRVLQPNLTYDPAATEQARALAAERIPPVVRTVGEGTPLLRPGQKITADDLVLLEEYRQALQSSQDKTDGGRHIAFSALLCLILVLVGAHALRALAPDIAANNTQLLLLATVVALQLAVYSGTTHAYLVTWQATHHLASVLPYALAGMLLAQLSGARAALLASLYLGAILALGQAMSLQVLLTATLSGITGAALMERARQRFQTYRAGLAAGGVVLLIGLVFLLREPLPWETLRVLLPKTALFSLGCGLLTATLAAAILPLFELLFGVTTDISLLELSDLNHPLLKRLQIEAPGTYHHSLVVATLAEQAAKEIDANPLLARVCAYFHDIGKLEHPDYFIENSLGRDRHKELRPRMSALVILNHVKLGITLAQKYKLKRPIREAIAQHHGTSLVYYFYRKEVDRAEKNASRSGDASGRAENQYRYPGPKPRRREIAILSLADACEAASRSLEKTTPQRLEALVRDIVEKRFRDGQLEEANLSFRELAVVRKTLARALGTMLHSRIKYPEEGNDEHPAKQTVPKTTPGEPQEAPANSEGNTAENRT